MTGTVAQIWRHPIKSHGRESLKSTALVTGQTLPWDRHWAVLHDLARHDGDGWAPCQNFMIGARIPALAGLWAELEDTTGTVTVRHQKLGEFRFRPDDPLEAQSFFAWLAPILPDDRAQPRRIVTAGKRGMTDSDFPSVSIMNMASHRAVSQKIGRPVESERWRGNIWLDGLAPWEEFDWIGRDLRIGAAMLRIREPIVRCMHTTANPVSGIRDTDTLGALEDGWGHQDFGVNAEVVQSGTVSVNDPIEVM
jgi:uncharacterized protein YcbX